MSDAGTVHAPTSRETKFRQAAFVYLHVSILYEAAAYEMFRAHLLPYSRLGSPLPWLIIGPVVALVVFWGLLRWRNPIFARIVWGVHALRLPPLIHGAYLAPADAPLPPAFYITAIVVVVVNLWMLARAGWDL